MSSLKKRASSKNSQGSLRKAGKDSKPEFKLVDNDPTSNKLLGLKDIKFLNTESKEVLSQAIDASEVQRKTGLMAEAYLKKQQTVASNVQKIIDKGRVAQMEIYKKSIADKEAEEKAKDLAKRNQSPGMASLMNQLERESPQKEQDKLADGFVRSKRNLAMRAKDSVNDGLHEIEEERNKLHENLSKALLRLDSLNQSKKEMQEKLVDQIKFVRDLQKASGGSGIDDLNSILSARTRDEYKRQKEMKAQLQEQLSRAERERQELLDRIKLLTGEKEVVVVNVNGQHKTYRVTTVNIERLINEIRDFKGQSHNLEHAIEQTREVLIRIEDELYQQERQLQSLRHERDHLFDKVAAQGFRQDEAIVCLEGEKRRMTQMHQMHIKLLATRLFQETFQKIINKTLKPYFEHARDVIEFDLSKMKAFFNFRKMIWIQDRRLQKKNLQKWYQLALKPTRIIKAACTLPVFLNKKEQLAFFYHKWRTVFRKKSKEFVETDRGCSRIISLWNKTQTRRQYKAFNQWRRFTQAGNRAILGFKKYMNFKDFQAKRDAFKTWQTLMVEQDFSVRMSALSIQLGLQMLAQKVLFAWRQETAIMKMLNRHRKLRAFKNMKVFVLRRKFAAQVNSKKYHYEILKFRKQVCFNFLRIWKEEKNLQKIITKLTGEVYKNIAEWKQEIQFRQTSSHLRDKRRAVRTLIINLFSKSLSQVLQQWRQAAIIKKYQKYYNLRSLLIKLYHTKQKIAYDRWRLCYAFQMNAAEVSKIYNLQVVNHQLEGDIKQKINEIEIENYNVKSLASKRLRKLVADAFERNLSHFLLKWCVRTQEHRAKQDAAAFILKKVMQRLLRIALTKYKRGVRICVQDSYNVRRTEEVQARLATRIKKRIVRGWINFSTNHRHATRYLANLVKTIDAHNKRKSFNNWKKFTIQERESNLLEIERGVVETIGDHSQDIGTLCDSLNQAEILNQRLSQILKTKGRMVLQKWVVRFHKGGKHYGFQMWKQVTINILQRNLFTQSVRRHLVLNNFRQAIVRWKQAISNDNQNKLADTIADSARISVATAESIALIRRMGEKNQKENQEKLVKVIETIRCETKKVQNTISALIVRNDNYYHMKRSRYILHLWYNYTNTRKKCVKAMVNGINKIFLQYAFNHIRKGQYKEYKNQMTQKAVNNILNVMNRLNTRFYISRWRLNILSFINFNIQQTDLQIQTIKQQHEIFVEHVKNHTVSLGAVRKPYLRIQKLFDSWRKVVFNWRVVRDQKDKLKQNIEIYQKKRFMIKWYTRQHNCVKLRRHVRLLQEKRQKIWLSAVWNALKYHFKVRKDLCVSVTRAIEGKMFEQKLLAFQSIVCRAQINNNSNLNSRLQACIVLFEKLCKLRRKNLSISVLKISESGLYNHKFLSLMKQLLAAQRTRQLRDSINKWKNYAQYQNIIEEMNHGTGPVNLKAWNLRNKMFALINQCGYDKAEEKQINQILKNEEDRNKKLMEKTICRWLVFKDDTLYLMPYCLDKLRLNAIFRRKFRRGLELLNRKAQAQKNHQDTYMAFQIWKKHCREKVLVLAAQTYRQLQKRTYKNYQKLNSLSDTVSDQNDTIQEYTDQRDMLLNGYISGQKLAVSLGVNNHKIAQQKAIMNLSDHGNLKLQGRIAEALHINLQQISELKDVIADQEVRNELLAESNDSFRIAALDAVLFARQIQDLQRDKDRLQQELHDRSVTIRKLLEDNQYLAYQIQDAAIDQKQKIEKQTQIALQQNFEREQMRQAERENISTVNNGTVNIGRFSPLRRTPH